MIDSNSQDITAQGLHHGVTQRPLRYVTLCSCGGPEDEIRFSYCAEISEIIENAGRYRRMSYPF
jgi:hypothetical protein